MKYIKMFESLSDRQVEDIVDLIYYRLEEEFEGNFFPLKVIANKYRSRTITNAPTNYDITVMLGPGIEDRLGGENEDWIFDYLSHIIKEKDLKRNNCSISNCAMSSSDRTAFYEMHNQCWPDGGHFDFLSGGYSFAKLPTNRKSNPDD